MDNSERIRRRDQLHSEICTLEAEIKILREQMVPSQADFSAMENDVQVRFRKIDDLKSEMMKMFD